VADTLRARWSEVEVAEGVRKRWINRAFWAAALLSGTASCGPSIGDCDMVALTATNPTMAVPYEGQRLIHQTCASGQCHSAAAKGAARVGAPADLNFDLVPADLSPAELTKVTRGESNVDELAEDMWEWIADGEMPPEGQREPLKGANKETVRNWLACGAPVVKQPLPVAASAEWALIFPSLEGTCGACHNASSTTGPWLALGDACATRANLLANVAVGPLCGPTGSHLVVPSSPDTSLIMQKLESPMPCGGVMPPDRAPAAPSALAPSLRQWIAAGALAPGCP
jgi:hypothetical protein